MNFPTVFIAGAVHDPNATNHECIDQQYRHDVSSLLEGYGARLIDPMQLVDFAPRDIPRNEARQLFKHIQEMVESADLLISVLPTPSMGAMLEMEWARKRGIPVVAITSMVDRWSVQLVSSVIVPSVHELRLAIQATAGLTDYIALLRRRA